MSSVISCPHSNFKYKAFYFLLILVALWTKAVCASPWPVVKISIRLAPAFVLEVSERKKQNNLSFLSFFNTAFAECNKVICLSVVM